MLGSATGSPNRKRLEDSAGTTVNMQQYFITVSSISIFWGSMKALIAPLQMAKHLEVTLFCFVFSFFIQYKQKRHQSLTRKLKSSIFGVTKYAVLLLMYN